MTVGQQDQAWQRKSAFDLLALRRDCEDVRVLIIPDKFKGTMTAREAAQAIARGWGRGRPGDRLELLPMSDGGDGFGEVLSQYLGARAQWFKTVNAAHQPCRSRWWLEPRGRLAIIESAAVIGLAMLPRGQFHPFELDTAGLGKMIRHVAKHADRCIIGIGGSATNDGGFGMARELGWRFATQQGELIERWTDLRLLEFPELEGDLPQFKELIVAVDVQNTLLGKHGATYVYGPQKGLRPADLPTAEKQLKRLNHSMAHNYGANHGATPGSGAGGGLGFGLMAFLGARVQQGFEVFATYAKLDQKLREADLVITGEGAIDRSTLMGKGVGRVAARSAQLKLPCLGLAGVAKVRPRQQKLFTSVGAMTGLTSEEEALAKPRYWLERLAAEVASNWTGSA